MQSHPIEAVSFDAAGTLIELAEPVGHSYSRVAAEHGNQVPPETLNTSFGAVWKRTPPPFSKEFHLPASDEKSWWKNLVAEVFRESGSPWHRSEVFHEFFEDLYLHFESPGTWLAVPDAEKVVKQVSQAFPCVVLSNFDGRLRRILSDLDLLPLFQEVILSSEHAASKPDARLFEAAAAALGKSPRQIPHVGDDPICDWHGAESAGFRHFRVGKKGSPLIEILGELSLA